MRIEEKTCEQAIPIDHSTLALVFILGIGSGTGGNGMGLIQVLFFTTYTKRIASFLLLLFRFIRPFFTGLDNLGIFGGNHSGPPPRLSTLDRGEGGQERGSSILGLVFSHGKPNGFFGKDGAHFVCTLGLRSSEKRVLGSIWASCSGMDLVCSFLKEAGAEMGGGVALFTFSPWRWCFNVLSTTWADEIFFFFNLTGLDVNFAPCPRMLRHSCPLGACGLAFQSPLYTRPYRDTQAPYPIVSPSGDLPVGVRKKPPVPPWIRPFNLDLDLDIVDVTDTNLGRTDTLHGEKKTQLTGPNKAQQRQGKT